MSKDKEIIKEVHHYHYIPYPSYIPYNWQYPWYPKNPGYPGYTGAPGYPGYTGVGPTQIGDITPKITWTTTSTSTIGKGMTIKYGANTNQLS